MMHNKKVLSVCIRAAYYSQVIIESMTNNVDRRRWSKKCIVQFRVKNVHPEVGRRIKLSPLSYWMSPETEKNIFTWKLSSTVHICASTYIELLYWMISAWSRSSSVHTCMEDRLRCCWIQTLSRPHELQIIHEVLSKTDNTRTWYLGAGKAIETGIILMIVDVKKVPDQTASVQIYGKV